MKKVLKEILQMPYFQNYAASSGHVHNVAKHEDAVEDILIKHQLQKWETSVAKEIRDGWLRGENDPLPDNCYIPQPCGTHDSPDFIVKKDGKLYFLECKSVKGRTPKYNSGVPKDNYIYILTSGSQDATTVYLGGDILPRHQARLISEHIEEARQRDKELNAKLSALDHGLSYYTRPAIEHNTRDKTRIIDYFRHPRRAELERNVLEFVSA
jgi:hypothetical protein